MLLLLVLFAIIVIEVCKKLKRNGRIVELTRKLAGPKAWPGIGNALELAVPQEDLMMKLVGILNEYKSPVRLWLGPDLYVIIDHPEHIKTILSSSSASTKGDPYAIIRDSIGNGLIQANGPKHKLHRKLISPFLRPNHVQASLTKMNQIFITCSQKLNENVQKGPFDIFPYMKHAALDMVTEVLLGYKMDVQRKPNEELNAALDGIYETVSNRLYKVWLHPSWIYRWTNGYRVMQESSRFMNKWIKTVVDKQRCSKHEAKDANGLPSTEIPLLKHILETPDENGNYMTEKEIHEEICLLFMAAEDTVATIASFTLLMLGMHEDVQNKVSEEQRIIFNSDPEIATAPHHLSNMIYLNMVIKEVLRLFPIAPVLVRKLDQDLVVGHHNLPEGINVMIMAYKTHKDPAIWDEPEKFIPERFSSENVTKRHPYAFIPFSGGSRSCIGKQFAYSALKCLISNIVRRYTVHSNWKIDNLKLTTDISIRSTNGYFVTLNKRT